MSAAQPYEGDLFSPATVKAEMDQVDAAVSTLDREIAAAGAKVRPIFSDSWAKYRASWIAFRNDNDGWLSRTLNSTRTLVADYQLGVTGWVDGFKLETGRKSLVALPRPTTTTALLKRVPWKKAGLGLGVVAVAYLLLRRR